MPRPVTVPRMRPGSTRSGAGGTNPSTPEDQARSACPWSANSATKVVTDLPVVVTPSSEAARYLACLEHYVGHRRVLDRAPRDSCGGLRRGLASDQERAQRDGGD